MGGRSREVAGPMKPRVYWHYYPDVKQGYWLVALAPHVWNDPKLKPLWQAAYAGVAHANNVMKGYPFEKGGSDDRGLLRSCH